MVSEYRLFFLSKACGRVLFCTVHYNIFNTISIIKIAIHAGKSFPTAQFARPLIPNCFETSFKLIFIFSKKATIMPIWFQSLDNSIRIRACIRVKVIIERAFRLWLFRWYNFSPDASLSVRCCNCFCAHQKNKRERKGKPERRIKEFFVFTPFTGAPRELSITLSLAFSGFILFAKCAIGTRVDAILASLKWISSLPRFLERQRKPSLRSDRHRATPAPQLPSAAHSFSRFESN